MSEEQQAKHWAATGRAWHSYKEETDKVEQAIVECLAIIDRHKEKLVRTYSQYVMSLWENTGLKWTTKDYPGEDQLDQAKEVLERIHRLLREMKGKS